jgi:hypothetical protein
MLSDNQAEKDKLERKLKRIIVNAKVLIIDTGDCLGYTANMHTEGVMLSSVDPIPVSMQYNVKFEYLRPDDEIVEIPLTIYSLWAMISNNPDFHHTGFKIMNPVPKQNLAIEKLLSELGSKD